MLALSAHLDPALMKKSSETGTELSVMLSVTLCFSGVPLTTIMPAMKHNPL